MINCTDRPIVVAKDDELDRRIRLGLKKFLNAIVSKHENQHKIDFSGEKDTIFEKSIEKACFTYYSSYELTKEKYGDAFIQATFDLVSVNSQNQGLSAAYKDLNVFLNQDISLSASVGGKLKGLTKLLLIALWSENAIILPFNFFLGGSALTHHLFILNIIETEVAGFFRGYAQLLNYPNNLDSRMHKSSAELLYKFGTRIIWSTDFHRFKDIQIVELCEFHQAIIGNLRSKNRYRANGPPITLILRELISNHKDRLSFTNFEFDKLVIWLHSPFARKYSFREYLERNVQISREYELSKLAKNERKNLARNSRRQQKVKISKENGLSDIAGNLRKQKNTIASENAYFTLLSGDDAHASIVEYFSKMYNIPRNGIGWLGLKATYVGREHIDLLEISRHWVMAWTGWLNYRKKVKGYDTEVTQNRAFNLFCDYLFLYLPWWKEIYPLNDVKLPLSPNELKRSIFVNRSLLDGGESLTIDKLPLTFLELLPRRALTSESRYGIIQQLLQFFEWVGVAYEDDDLIAGKSYRNPFNRIDLPRTQKKSKTTKIPFSKRVYPHLLFYSYAVEAFGEYFQQFQMERPGVFSNTGIQRQKFISTGPLPNQITASGSILEEHLKELPENYGYTPYISYRGKNFPIYSIPNVYQWANRAVKLGRYDVGSDDVEDRWLPHLTCLRMLIGALETGLRLQSIQWLDLRSWDLINNRKNVPINYSFNFTNSKNNQFALPIYIPTDKTKEEAWEVLTVFRVRACFYREQYFRDSIHEKDLDLPVDYDGNKNSRFGKIIPLFRSHNSPDPISDAVYSKYWVHLLLGFEEHFKLNVSKENEFEQFVYFKGTDREKVESYSDVNTKQLLAINTPHACRSTYATNRVGILEISDVAQQLGHANTIVTAHYTISTPENMAEKLKNVENEILRDFHSGQSTPAYIRADSKDGALFNSFKEDRISTIDKFKFAPSITLWNTSDLNADQNGIEMLKISPMSQIVFRETHICPVGESCPADILASIQQPKRCGLCPLAMRCVDHLPAIAAKINQLKMSVRNNILRAEQLDKKGEPDSTVDPFYDAAELDANEIVGWQLSHDILLTMLEADKNEIKGEYHIQSPEIVKKHLKVVSKNKTLSDFFLQRISDANAFPSMADPDIMRVAERYCRFLLSEKHMPILTEDPISTLVAYIRTHLDPLGLSISDIVKRIDSFENDSRYESSVLLKNQQFLLNNIQGDE